MKNIFAGLIAAIAFLLIWTASNVSATSSIAFIVSSIVLMGVYCVGQYRFGKSYR